MAINWLVAQQNVVTIAKSSSPEHLQENLGGVGWYLPPTEVERLRQEYPHSAVSDVLPPSANLGKSR